MTDEQKQPAAGWTEGALSAVIDWFPGLPQTIKVIFASATIYLVLCLVAQVPPTAPFEAFFSEFRADREQHRVFAAQDRDREHKERADLIALLLEQNRELRMQAKDNPDLAARVRELERKMQALLDTHPRERMKVEAGR